MKFAEQRLCGSLFQLLLHDVPETIKVRLQFIDDSIDLLICGAIW